MTEPYKMTIDGPNGQSITSVVCDEDEYWEAIRSAKYTADELAHLIKNVRILVKFGAKTEPIFNRFDVDHSHLLALAIRSAQTGLDHVIHDPADPPLEVKAMNDLYNGLNYFEKEFVDEMISKLVLIPANVSSFFEEFGTKISAKFDLYPPNRLWRVYSKTKIVPSYEQTMTMMRAQFHSGEFRARVYDYTRRFLTLMFVHYRDNSATKFKALKET
jgi:hypothetical protein